MMSGSTSSRTPVIMCGNSARQFSSPCHSPQMSTPVVPCRTRNAPSGSVGSDERVDNSTLRFIRSLVGPALSSKPIWHFLSNCDKLPLATEGVEDPVLTVPRLRTAVAEVLGFLIRQVASVNSLAAQRVQQHAVQMPPRKSLGEQSAMSSSAPSSPVSPVGSISASFPATATASPSPSPSSAGSSPSGSSRSSFEFREDRRPSVSLETYIFMWICQCDCDVELCLVALLYLDRLSTILPLSRQNCHRLWAAAMVVAIKTYSDFVKTNKQYSQIAGVPLSELNVLERNFLQAIDFNVIISKEEWDQYYTVLHKLVVLQYSEGLSLFFAAHTPHPDPEPPKPRRKPVVVSKPLAKPAAKPQETQLSFGERLRVTFAQFFNK